MRSHLEKVVVRDITSRILSLLLLPFSSAPLGSAVLRRSASSFAPAVCLCFPPFLNSFQFHTPPLFEDCVCASFTPPLSLSLRPLGSCAFERRSERVQRRAQITPPLRIFSLASLGRPFFIEQQPV